MRHIVQLNRHRFSYIFIGLVIFLSGLVGSLALYQPNSPSPQQELNSQTSNLPKSPTPTPYTPPPLEAKGMLDQTNQCTDQECWSVMVTGDIMLGRAVNATYLSSTKNYFQEIGPLLRRATISIINLETTILEECAPTLTGMRFCADISHLESLSAAGVDITSLANNHAMTDYFSEGREQTYMLLDEKGLRPVLQYQVQTIHKDEHPTVAVIGVDTVIHAFDEAKFAQSMQEATESAEIVLPFFSWGLEYVATPSSQQRSIASKAVDLGATAVLGNHPHWVQGIELIDNVPVIYSHGNTIFDQLWSEETREGIISELYFYQDLLVDIVLHPVYIDESYIPQLLDRSDQTSNRIFERIKQGSSTL